LNYTLNYHHHHHHYRYRRHRRRHRGRPRRHDVAPAYLGELCVPATASSGRQHLRSAATGTLWFHAPVLQLDNEVSQSTDQPHGTVCHQHYSHRTAPSSGH